MKRFLLSLLLVVACVASATELQKGDSVLLRRTITDDNSAYEDSRCRLVVCHPHEAEYVGLVVSTAGGVTTIRSVTADAAREIYAVLHVSQTVLALGDTLVFSGRQTYFYPDNKMKTLRMYKPDGTLEFSVDYDRSGATVRSIQGSDTIQYTLVSHPMTPQAVEPLNVKSPEELSGIHAGDSLWLTEINDDYEIMGDYSEETLHDVECIFYVADLIFYVAYTDLERSDQCNRLVVSSPDQGGMLGVVDSVDQLGVTLRVYSDRTCRQLHSQLHVATWSMHPGDTLAPNGKQTYYYPTGQIKCEREFKETGVYEGEKTYDLSGRLINSQSRQDTILFREFYPSGALRQAYVYSPAKHKERWYSYAEDGSKLDTLLCTRLAPYDDGVYIEYESTPSIPAGELPDSEVAQADYTINEPVECMRFHTSNMQPMVLHPLWKEGRWRDRKEKYLIPRAYFVKNTRWFDAFTPDDSIRAGSYSCIVNREGKIHDVVVDRSVGVESLDLEMVEALRKMPIYRPGGIVRRKVGADREERIPHAYKLRFAFGWKRSKVTAVEVMPEFPGGKAALEAYLKANVKYPKVAQMNGIQGRTVCRFIVDKDGTVTQVKVVRSSGDASLDAEALRVLRAMPKWSPGKKKGKPVRVKYTTPVNFRLE